MDPVPQVAQTNLMLGHCKIQCSLVVSHIQKHVLTQRLVRVSALEGR